MKTYPFTEYVEQFFENNPSGFQHSLRVAMLVLQYQPDNDILYKIALAHDLLEDTECDYADLRLAYPSFADDILALTRQENETYCQYIDRILQSSRTVQVVKLYDIIDHLACINTLTPSLRTRYTETVEKLTAVLTENK